MSNAICTRKRAEGLPEHVLSLGLTRSIALQGNMSAVEFDKHLAKQEDFNFKTLNYIYFVRFKKESHDTN